MRSRIAPLIAAALLGACSAPTVTPAPATANTPPTSLSTPASATATVSPTPPPMPEPTSTLYDLSFLNELPPDAILLQLETQASILDMSPDSKLLAFTLYRDGTVIYIHNLQDELRGIMVSHLDEQEIQDLMRRAITPDIENIVGYSYDEVCPGVRIENASCITDMPSVVLRVRVDTRTLHEIQAYNHYTSNPQVFDPIVELLALYHDPEATLYAPESYWLFFWDIGQEGGVVPEWPLSADVLSPNVQLPSDWFGATSINQEQAAQLITVGGTNYGAMLFESQGDNYVVWLVPQLPDGQPIGTPPWFSP